jgi:hypothetical protein
LVHCVFCTWFTASKIWLDLYSFTRKKNLSLSDCMLELKIVVWKKTTSCKFMIIFLTCTVSMYLCEVSLHICFVFCVNVYVLVWGSYDDIFLQTLLGVLMWSGVVVRGWYYFPRRYSFYYPEQVPHCNTVFSGPSGSLSPALLSVKNWVPLKPVLGCVRDVAICH